MMYDNQVLTWAALAGIAAIATFAIFCLANDDYGVTTTTIPVETAVAPTSPK